MWARQAYYFIKPLIPRRVQIALRRQKASRTLDACRDIWPIDERAAQRPARWTGWPERKRFALVLTHDVDTARGQERAAKLMELEEKLGFRSSFNFVPLRYPDSAVLRQTLLERGFEVGVHGLYHDGKYYTTKSGFLSRAAKINEFLRAWNAVGYRAPSMLHKLEWFHHFNIEYDASTFDTDPFEPNSKGFCTIFPFVVEGGPGQKEYIELPYTLPQDFTVFILLKQEGPEIWKRKLHWIAKNGGMVLINTHPDYMHFGKGKPGYEEYPAAYYEQFLTTTRETYEGQYWHALPKDLARFWQRTMARRGRGMRFKSPTVNGPHIPSPNEHRQGML